MRRWFAVFLLLLVLTAATAQEPAGISIRGHIYVGNTGAPSYEARVTLTNESIFRTKVGTITTNDAGAFVFSGLAQGSYTLDVEQAGFLTEYVPDAEPANEIVVRLRRVAVVSGRVTGAAGESVAKASVEVMKKSYAYGEVSLQSAQFAWTDNSGMYRISGLAPGQYYVRASRDGYDTIVYPRASDLAGAQSIELTEGDQKAGIDFPLGSSPRFTLTGRLVDSETAVQVQAKSLRAVSADLVAGMGVSGVLNGGQFRLAGLKSGRYFLIFTWVGPTNNVTRTADFPFEMHDADQSEVVLRATRVNVAGHLKAVGHAMPSNLTVYLEPVAAALRASVGSHGGANVAPDGSFEMAGVESGEYHLRVHSGNPARFFRADRIVVVDGRGPITGIELDLDFSAGSISGSAVDATGKPMPRATVVLQSVDSEKLTDDLYRHVYRASPGGEYSISGVSPGEYLLFAWRGDPGLIGDPELFAEARETARRVTIGPRSTISQDAIELRPKSRLGN